MSGEAPIHQLFQMVEDVARSNHQVALRVRSPKDNAATGPFHSVSVPPVPLADYGCRIFKYARQSVDVAAVAVALMLRHQQASDEPQLAITPHSMHRLLLAASLVAAKAQSDHFYSNKYYAQIGGVAEHEVHHLETAFLNQLEWSVHVSLAEHSAVIRAAEIAATARQQAAQQRLPADAVAAVVARTVWEEAGLGLRALLPRLAAEPSCPLAVSKPTTFREILAREEAAKRAAAMEPATRAVSRMASLNVAASPFIPSSLRITPVAVTTAPNSTAMSMLTTPVMTLKKSGSVMSLYVAGDRASVSASFDHSGEGIPLSLCAESPTSLMCTPVPSPGSALRTVVVKPPPAISLA